MSQYVNRWAFCEHGRKNRRVCVECWETMAEGRVVKFSGRQDPTSFDTPGVGFSDIELTAPGMKEELPAKMEIESTPALESKFAALMGLAHIASQMPTVESRLNEEGKRILEFARDTTRLPYEAVFARMLTNKPAIDRRDHEWKSRVLIPKVATPMNARMYRDKWGWKS